MRLRKIELKEKREDYFCSVLSGSGDLSWYIPQRLALWFDGVSATDFNGLKQMLKELYPLREKECHRSDRNSSDEPKVEVTNYGKGCFPYEFFGELRHEELNYPHRNPNLSHSLKVAGGYTLNDARTMKKILKESAEVTLHYEYLKFLEEHLKQGSGARIWMMGNPEGWNYGDMIGYGNLTKSPTESPFPFQPSLVEAVFFPPRQDVLRSLMGLLMEREAGYETPHHQEILEGILKGNITSYGGHAGREFEKQGKESQKGKLAIA